MNDISVPISPSSGSCPIPGACAINAAATMTRAQSRRGRHGSCITPIQLMTMAAIAGGTQIRSRRQRSSTFLVPDLLVSCVV
jgi:hypothetical protein